MLIGSGYWGMLGVSKGQVDVGVGTGVCWVLVKDMLMWVWVLGVLDKGSFILEQKRKRKRFFL